MMGATHLSLPLIIMFVTTGKVGTSPPQNCIPLSMLKTSVTPV